MINRSQHQFLEEMLKEFPVLALLGPRQVGKTTLARAICEQGGAFSDAIFLDMERPSDHKKLEDPELYLSAYADRLVVIDEVQRRPDLFPLIRALVDDNRRPGRFLLLGSASPDLKRQSSESLAGRIVQIEIAGLSCAEVTASEAHELPAGVVDSAPEQMRETCMRRLWLRGGFPDSYLAKSDAASQRWRLAFIKTFLEQDLPTLGIRVPAASMHRFWQMIAHHHGQTWNASRIAGSLGVTGPSVVHYLDILEDTFMLRRLQPYHGNLKKRLVKAPKIYIRDSGLVHTLLGISTWDDILGHPITGASWEGWCIEQILGALPQDWDACYFRTQAGAEIDLVLSPPGGAPPIAIEIKHSLSPSPSKGFWSGIEDIQAQCAYVLYPGNDVWPLAKNVTVVPVHGIAERLFLKK